VPGGDCVPWWERLGSRRYGLPEPDELQPGIRFSMLSNSILSENAPRFAAEGLYGLLNPAPGQAMCMTCER